MNGKSVTVKVRVLENAGESLFIPQYASNGAAGMDLRACIESAVTLEPMQRARIPTGIAIQLPSRDLVALVYARSGLAWRHGLTLSNGVGVIDSDYTGEIQVLMTNFGEESVIIERNDRIAQVVVGPIQHVTFEVVSGLAETDRAEGGFGSTGV